MERSVNNYRYLCDNNNNPPPLDVGRLYKSKKNRSKNKFFNVPGQGIQDRYTIVPQQVFDALRLTLILQVPCPGDTINRDCDSLLFAIKKYCKEIGYSSKIKGELYINKGNRCTSRNKTFVYAMFEIILLQMYMNDCGPISGPLKGWETTPANIQDELVSIQQSLINYVWEEEVPNADVFFPGGLVYQTMPFVAGSTSSYFCHLSIHQTGRTNLVLK